MTGSILTASASAETHALNEAIASLRTAPDGLKQLGRQMELLTARCAAYPQETRQLWEWFEAQEPIACVDDEDFRAIFQNHLALLDDRIRLVKQVRSLTAEIGQGNDSSLYEAPLAEALKDLIAQQNHIAGLWERMNAPLPPETEPLPSRAELRAAFERGEYETTESILARLLAGGPLCKDDAE